MVSFTNVLIAVVAATGVTAQQQTNCPEGRLLCGWLLNSGTFGYTRETLQAAAQSTDDNFVFNSIYCCSSGGTIIWNTFCAPGAGHCQNIPAENPDDFCR